MDGEKERYCPDIWAGRNSIRHLAVLLIRFPGNMYKSSKAEGAKVSSGSRVIPAEVRG